MFFQLRLCFSVSEEKTMIKQSNEDKFDANKIILPKTEQLCQFRLFTHSLKQFCRALDIIFDITHSVQIRSDFNKIYVSGQDVYLSSQFEFLIDDIQILTNNLPNQPTFIKMFCSCDELRSKLNQTIKPKLKDNRLVNVYPYWLLTFSKTIQDEFDLRLEFADEIITQLSHPSKKIFSSTSSSSSSFSLSSSSSSSLAIFDSQFENILYNHIFEASTEELLLAILHMCLGNGFFFVEFGQEYITPISLLTTKIKNIPSTKQQKKKTAPPSDRIKPCWKLYFVTQGIKSFLRITVKAVAKQIPICNDIQSLFCALSKEKQRQKCILVDRLIENQNGTHKRKLVDPLTVNEKEIKKYKKIGSSHTTDEEEKKEEGIETTKQEQKQLNFLTKNYFATKFLKSFLTNLNRKQNMCLVYFIENQRRIVFEPKDTSFRLVLLPQTLEKALEL